jgi:uncharacterized membrane protein YuzA (DUF378 family)
MLPQWLVIVCLVVVLVGGINWLVTGIRSVMNNNQPVDDLLEMLPECCWNQMASNIVYYVVFICSVLLFLPLLSRM